MSSTNDERSSPSSESQEHRDFGHHNYNQSFRNLQELLSENKPSPPTIDPPARRGRARSNTLQSRENPAESPLNAEQQSLSDLIREINKQNAAEQAAKARARRASAGAVSIGASDTSKSIDPDFTKKHHIRSESAVFNPLSNDPIQVEQATLNPAVCPPKAANLTPRVTTKFGFLNLETPRQLPAQENSLKSQGNIFGQPLLPNDLKIRSINTVNKSREGKTAVMNYNSFIENPQGSGSNPRQAPSPNQGMNHANGVNGNNVGLPGMMAGLPTPAGHQSDLNNIYAMVEELSRALEENRAATARIVDGVGRVRQRAMEKEMTNEELIASVAAELNDSTRNLEVEAARLEKELDRAKFEAKEYFDIAYAYAKSMATMLEQLHAFKAKTVADMCAWHMSYRDQLAAERKENLELRCRITDMQASAARGLEAMRKFRAEWDGSPAYWEYRTENISLRQQVRSWKRMAMPYMPDDDSEFSDDDDMIDPEEKKRLAKEHMAKCEQKLAEKNAAGGGDGDGGDK